MAQVKDTARIAHWIELDVFVDDRLVPLLVAEVFSPLNRWGAGLRYGQDPTTDQLVTHYVADGAWKRLLDRYRLVDARQNRDEACSFQSPKQ